MGQSVLLFVVRIAARGGSLLVRCTSVSLPSKVRIHACAVYPGKPYLSAAVSLEDPGCFAFSDRLVSCCFACPGPTLVAFNCFVVYRFVSSPIPCRLLRFVSAPQFLVLFPFFSVYYLMLYSGTNRLSCAFFLCVSVSYVVCFIYTVSYAQDMHIHTLATYKIVYLEAT